MGEAARQLDPETELREAIGEFVDDPLGYVMFNFPWRVEGTPLEAFDGPDVWQRDYLVRLGEEIRARGFDPKNPIPVDPIQMAVASGHGIGKGALTSMVTCFILDTRPGSKGMITANTGEQLRSKTFAELSKWRKMSLTSHWWEVSSGDMYVRNVEDPENWRVDAITWRKETSEAFAGLHAATASPFYIFDEASAIHEKIFEVSQGGLTDGEPFRLVFGNPTRNVGAFFEAFHRNRHRWVTWQIDSRDCHFPNKRQLNKWIEDYGEDSDFCRVRVKGTFPRAGSKQFIAHDTVEEARTGEVDDAGAMECVVIGCDVARFGADESVIVVRRGKDARSYPWRYYRGLDTMQLAARCAEVHDELVAKGLQPTAICVDGGGVGGGVVDRLEQLGYPVIEVNFGSKPDSPDRYLYKRDEMWDRMRDWLKNGGKIPDDDVLQQQLVGRPYEYTPRMQLAMWSKKDMQEKLGLESPDRADALGLTHAEQLAPRTLREAAEQGGCVNDVDGDPYANM